MTAAIVVAPAIAGWILWMAAIVRIGLVSARMFQLEEYDTRRLLRWAWTTPGWFGHRAALIGALVSWVIAGAGAVRGVHWAVAVAWAVGGVVANVAWRWTPAKKGLVSTPRVRRLLITAAILTFVIAAVLWVLVVVASDINAALAVVVAQSGLMLIPLLLLIVANALMAPVEGRQRRMFLTSARAKLVRIHPDVIAVAGSYGKTTTKRILAHLLEGARPTLPTPKSFNTLMGITRTINDDLDERHRAFVVEMDAYNPGEIAAMCDLVQPRIAVITSVGPQHLERFHSMQRIEDALYEAVDALPDDGTAIIHAGDAYSAALAARARAGGAGAVVYGFDGDAEDLDVVARDVVVSGDGTSFTWVWKAEQLEERVVVPLLGRHQALNATAALAVLHTLGDPLPPALRAMADLEAVEHRLQVLPTTNGITVIDDSYNANPVGVHNALEVLAEVKANRRILVTPGLVELGPVEDDENRRYGVHAAEVCDDVIVVSARTTEAIVAGLQAGGLAQDHIHVVGSLDGATVVIGQVARSGDVVLFANDLPDTY